MISFGVCSGLELLNDVRGLRSWYLRLLSKLLLVCLCLGSPESGLIESDGYQVCTKCTWKFGQVHKFYNHIQFCGGRKLWLYLETWESLKTAPHLCAMSSGKVQDPTNGFFEEAHLKDLDLHMRKEIHLGSLS